MKTRKIAFVNCPIGDVKLPPVGIACLSTYLSSKGYTTKIFDFNIQLYDKASNKKWWRRTRIYHAANLNKIKNFEFFSDDAFTSLAREVLNYKPEVVCFSLNYASFIFALKVAKKIKELNNNCFIILGGPSASNELFLSKGINLKEHANLIIIGEGEKTLYKVLRNLNKIKKKKTPMILEGELVKDLDELPIPDYKGFDLNVYKHCKEGVMPLVDSRGCCYGCNFCFEKNYWKVYRTRSPKQIVKEFELRKKQGFKEVFFSDSLLNGNIKNMDMMCEELIKKRLNMAWQGNATINRFMTYGRLKNMKKAGCYCLTYGADSASKKVLKAMNKKLTAFEISKAVIKTKLAGIRVHTNWIVGFPNESWIDFLKTVVFIVTHRPFISVLAIIPARVPPNTNLYKEHGKFDICKGVSPGEDWKTLDNKNNARIRLMRWRILIVIASFLGYGFPV